MKTTSHGLNEPGEIPFAAQKVLKLPIFSRQPRRHINEDFIIVWLDSNIVEDDVVYKDYIAELRCIIDSISTFTNVDRCINYLTQIKTKAVFFILSDVLNEQHIRYLQDLYQITSIYVFYNNKFNREHWIYNFSKIKGIHSNFDFICDELRQEVQRFNNSLTAIHFVKSSDIDSNELNPSFMYTQLLKEILLQIEYDNEAKAKFVEYCRLHYGKNSPELCVIDELERIYERQSPAWWYTRGSSLYCILNKALRTQNIEVILKMGFFIRDLHQQIEQLHSVSDIKRSFVVYRGQGMLNSEFEAFIKNKSDLLSFNNFLSTSTNIEVAMSFAESARSDPNLIGVLFRMEINPLISSTPFASLDNISYYSNFEKEILFSMHSVFRIGELKQINDRLWQMDLRLTTDNDQQLKLLTEHMRKVTQGATVWHRLGWLMIQMGQFDLAEETYNAIIKITNNDTSNELAFCLHQLGYILKEKGDWPSALSHYKESLVIKLSYLPLNDPSVSLTYSNIGGIYKQRGDLDKAVKYFQRALNISLQNPSHNRQKIAISYNNIGSVHRAQGKYDEALECYEQTLKIYHVDLPPRHPLLGITYNNMGLVHLLKEDYLLALSYFEKTLNLFEKTIPLDHPLLSMAHYSMAKTLEGLHRLEEAIEHTFRAIDIVDRAFGINHSKALKYRTYLQELREKLSLI